MTIEFTVTAIIPVSPQTIYDTWLDSEGHSKMTGSPAHATATVTSPTTLATSATLWKPSVASPSLLLVLVNTIAATFVTNKNKI